MFAKKDISDFREISISKSQWDLFLIVRYYFRDKKYEKNVQNKREVSGSLSVDENSSSYVRRVWFLH